VHIMFVLKGKDQNYSIHDFGSNGYDVTVELEMIFS
jgi:hypothetical protein